MVVIAFNKKKQRYERSIFRTKCKTMNCKRASTNHIGLCHPCYADPILRASIPRENRTPKGLALTAPQLGKTCQPTTYPPGTIGKLRVLQERAANGLPLWHPLDAKQL